MAFGVQAGRYQRQLAGQEPADAADSDRDGHAPGWDVATLNLAALEGLPWLGTGDDPEGFDPRPAMLERVVRRTGRRRAAIRCGTRKGHFARSQVQQR
jgi:hypothetical protein